MKIITISGSMKFAKEMHKIAGELEIKMDIALSNVFMILIKMPHKKKWQM